MNASDEKSNKEDEVKNSVVIGSLQEAGAPAGGVFISVIIGFIASRKTNSLIKSINKDNIENIVVYSFVSLFAILCIIGEICDEKFMHGVYMYAMNNFMFFNNASPAIHSVVNANFMTNIYRESIVFTIDIMSCFLCIVITFDVFMALINKWRVYKNMYNSSVVVDIGFSVLITYMMYIDSSFASPGRIFSNKYLSIINVCVFEAGIYYCVHSAINRIVKKIKCVK